jgi:hypothetical protein
MTDILDERHTVEATLRGAEAVAGHRWYKAASERLYGAMVQIGGPAVRVPTPALMSRLPDLPYLRGALQRYNALLLRRTVISVGCNRFLSTNSVSRAG